MQNSSLFQHKAAMTDTQANVKKSQQCWDPLCAISAISAREFSHYKLYAPFKPSGLSSTDSLMWKQKQTHNINTQLTRGKGSNISHRSSQPIRVVHGQPHILYEVVIQTGNGWMLHNHNVEQEQYEPQKSHNAKHKKHLKPNKASKTLSAAHFDHVFVSWNVPVGAARRPQRTYNKQTQNSTV